MGGRKGRICDCYDDSHNARQSCEWAAHSSAYIVAAAVGRRAVDFESTSSTRTFSGWGQRPDSAIFKGFSDDEQWSEFWRTSSGQGDQCRQYDRGKYWFEVLERYRR